MTTASFVRHRITALPGDGIGHETVPAGIRVLDAAAAKFGFALDWVEQPWGSDYYKKHGRMMPLNAIETMSSTDAIFLGAVGDPEISDVETLWGMLIPIRRDFDQYINLRPIMTLPGVDSPLRDSANIDLVVVRENVEGEYSAVGGRSYPGRPAETAYQQSIFTRHGIARAATFAAELALSRKGEVMSATKSNGIIHTMTFWDEVVKDTFQLYPTLELRSMLIDALSAALVLKPQAFDVIVASNLFGDILSDIAAATVGSIGVAPSANLNPERLYPSLFEPVHGSAPDIAGKGIANPTGQIWAGAMMLTHLGHTDASTAVIDAFVTVLGSGISTPDLGGTATTSSFTDAVLAELV
jgi:tartrate dehydrogenase/decarboxylase/D-malate dehydrogenase